MFGEDRYHRMDFDYETPEWIGWVIGLQKDSWSALYEWFEGLLELEDAEEIGIYFSEIPLSIYNYIETENIGINAIVALYVSSLIILMRMSGFLQSMVGLLDVAYKLIAPITPDYLLKYIPLWILRSAFYYLVIVLKVVSLVWKETFGAVAQIGSRMALSVSLPWLMVGLAIWNWRLFVCEEIEDHEEEGETVGNEPLLGNIPGADDIIDTLSPLFCWLPYFSTVYNIVYTGWQLLKDVVVETINAIITAISEVVGIIAGIIGGIGGICDGDLNGAVGGKDGDFCKGLAKGKTDMQNYQKELEVTKCKLTVFKDNTDCGYEKCDKDNGVSGGQITYAECSGGEVDWTKEKYYLPPGVKTFSIYNHRNKVWMCIRGTQVKRVDAETTETTDTNQDNDSRVVFRDEKYAIVDKNELVQGRYYYIQSFRNPEWYLGVKADEKGHVNTLYGTKSAKQWVLIDKGGNSKLGVINSGKWTAAVRAGTKTKQGNSNDLWHWKTVSENATRDGFHFRMTGSKEWTLIKSKEAVLKERDEAVKANVKAFVDSRTDPAAKASKRKCYRKAGYSAIKKMQCTALWGPE